MSQFRMPLLRLYRTILKQHNKKLPYEMKKLGDDYVRAEFRSIKKAKKDEQVKIFIEQWELYLNTLERQKEIVGIKMKKSIVDRLDGEQRAQLEKLKEAALRGDIQLPDIDVRPDLGPPNQ